MNLTKRESRPSKPRPIRVLVADDFPIVREGLTTLLNCQKDMQVVAEASDGQSAVEQFVRYRPDVALLDMRMPKLDGIAALSAILNQVPGARVILLTAFAGDELIYRALRAGAKSYLLKNTPRQDLLTAIRTIYHDDTCIPPVIAAKLVDRITRTELTSRELEVLQLMAVGKSNKEIGVSLYISEGTVKAHVSKLLGKLKATSRTEAINIAILHGIVTVDPS